MLNHAGYLKRWQVSLYLSHLNAFISQLIGLVIANFDNSFNLFSSSIVSGLLWYRHPKHRRMYRLVLIVQYASHGAAVIPPDVISQPRGFVDGEALRVNRGEPVGYGVGRIKSPLAPLFQRGDVIHPHVNGIQCIASD